MMHGTREKPAFFFEAVAIEDVAWRFGGCRAGSIGRGHCRRVAVEARERCENAWLVFSG